MDKDKPKSPPNPYDRYDDEAKGFRLGPPPPEEPKPEEGPRPADKPPSKPDVHP